MSYIEVGNRHSSVQEVVEFFYFDHLDEPLRGVSESCADFVIEMLDQITFDSPELTIALRRTLEAKDAYVRAMIVEMKNRALEDDNNGD